jgi:hypothetical protein
VGPRFDRSVADLFEEQKGYDKNILPLVDKTTEKLIEKQLPGADAFIIWATAQMISLPVKIRACVR